MRQALAVSALLLLVFAGCGGAAHIRPKPPIPVVPDAPEPFVPLTAGLYLSETFKTFVAKSGGIQCEVGSSMAPIMKRYFETLFRKVVFVNSRTPGEAGADVIVEPYWKWFTLEFWPRPGTYDSHVALAAIMRTTSGWKFECVGQSKRSEPIMSGTSKSTEDRLTEVASRTTEEAMFKLSEGILKARGALCRAVPDLTPQPGQTQTLLAINTLKNGQKVAAESTLLGATVVYRADGGHAEITVNGQPVTLGPQDQWAAGKSADGRPVVSLAKDVPLKAGDNTIVLRAVEKDGGKTEQSVVVQRPAAPTFAAAAEVRTLITMVNAQEDRNIRAIDARDSESAAIEEFLTATGGSSPRIYKLSGMDASRKSLIAMLRKAADRTMENDLLVLFFVGHVVEDPSSNEVYFLTSSAQLDNLNETAYSLSELRKELQQVCNTPNVLLVLDGCHSPFSRSTGHAFDVSFVPRHLQRLAQARSRIAVLTACSDQQNCVETASGAAHSVFTPQVVQAMKGAADGDDDGYVSVQELAAHVQKGCDASTSGKMRPILAGATDVPVSRRAKKP